MMAKERVEQATQHQQDKEANLVAVAVQWMPEVQNDPEKAKRYGWNVKTREANRRLTSRTIVTR